MHWKPTSSQGWAFQSSNLCGCSSPDRYNSGQSYLTYLQWQLLCFNHFFSQSSVPWHHNLPVSTEAPFQLEISLGWHSLISVYPVLGFYSPFTSVIFPNESFSLVPAPNHLYVFLINVFKKASWSWCLIHCGWDCSVFAPPCLLDGAQKSTLLRHDSWILACGDVRGCQSLPLLTCPFWMILETTWKQHHMEGIWILKRDATSCLWGFHSHTKFACAAPVNT